MKNKIVLKRIYLSGPMTNIPDLNRPAFAAAEKRLTAGGNFVINPHRISELFGTAEKLVASFAALYRLLDGKLPNGANHLWKEEMRKADERESALACAVMDADLAAVRSCDAIYLLRGWKTSRGARRELAEALKYGLEIFEEGDEE